MKTKFWTTLQDPICTAVLVENGTIINRIPPHSPKTITRRVGQVGEYKDTLVLLYHASFEQWNREGTKCLRSFHMKQIYAPHRIVQYEEDLLICSSGLDLFFIMDLEGNVKWEWWGYKYGVGGWPDYYFKKDWVTNQVTTNLLHIPLKDAAHFNSIWVGDGKFLTSALEKREIIEITPYKEGYKHVAWVEGGGLHSPIYHDGILMYGTTSGIQIGKRKVLTQYHYVKYIQRRKNGFAFTCERGVVLVDEEWRVIEEVSLSKPFQLAFLEVEGELNG